MSSRLSAKCAADCSTLSCKKNQRSGFIWRKSFTTSGLRCWTLDHLKIIWSCLVLLLLLKRMNSMFYLIKCNVQCIYSKHALILYFSFVSGHPTPQKFMTLQLSNPKEDLAIIAAPIALCLGCPSISAPQWFQQHCTSIRQYHVCPVQSQTSQKSYYKFEYVLIYIII